VFTYPNGGTRNQEDTTMIFRYSLIGITANNKEVVVHPGYRSLEDAKSAYRQYRAQTHAYPKYTIRQVTLDAIPDWERTHNAATA
jgi:hypothetical protein